MTGEAVEVADDALEKQCRDMKISEMGDGVKPEKSSPKKGRSYEDRLKEWEEKQANKEVVERGCKGIVKWYSVSGRYGFIARGDGIDDVFVHQSAITKSTAEKFWQRSLADDQEVEFDLLRGEKGLEAGNVTGPDGEPVKSSPFRRYFRGSHGGKRRDKTLKEEGEKAEGKGEDGDDKPHRYVRNRTRRNKNKPNGEKTVDGEKKEGEEKPKRVRHRRNRSDSNPKAFENVNKEAAAPQADSKE